MQHPTLWLAFDQIFLATIKAAVGLLKSFALGLPPGR